MPDLFIANKNYSSWSLRPWVLMRELQIAFNERLQPFQGEATAEVFRRFSPSAKVPCLVDGETVVWDSLAITEYLAEQYPQVWPLDTTARAWARSASAEMHSGFASLRSLCTMNCGLRIRLGAVTPGLRADLDRLDQLWTEGFSRFGGPHLAGDCFTAVDAFFAPVAFRVQTYGLVLSANSLAYVSTLLALPPMQEWYEAALEESWRDDSHEQEARQAGEIVDDVRTRP